MKRMFFVLLILWIVVFAIAFYSFLPITWPEKDNIEYNEQTLLVEYQATTGPLYVVINGVESIRQYYENSSHKAPLDAYEIELTGMLPSDRISFPTAYESQYIVHGTLIGMTDQYCDTGSGSIPVFDVTSWKPTTYLPMIRASKSTVYRSIVRIVIFASPGLLVVTLFSLWRCVKKKRPREQR